MTEMRDAIVGKLFDNWERRQRLEADNNRLILKAVDSGVKMDDIMNATGLSRTTIWRIRKDAEQQNPGSSVPYRTWTIRVGDTSETGVPDETVQDTIENLLYDRFDALGPEPDNDEGIIPAIWFDDTEHMNDEQKALADDARRLARQAIDSDRSMDRIEDEKTGVILVNEQA